MRSHPERAPYRRPTIKRINLVGEETAAAPKSETMGAGPNLRRTEWLRDLFGVRCRESRGS
jgi:hypothetical protein